MPNDHAIDLHLGENLDVFSQGADMFRIAIRIKGAPPMVIQLDEARDLMVALGHAITTKEIEAASAFDANPQPQFHTFTGEPADVI